MTPVQDNFQQRLLDLKEAPVLLPDIGTFFNQDISLAKELIHQIHEAGVQYLKAEILHDADICLATGVQEAYLNSHGEVIKENYRTLIERKVVPLDAYTILFELCQSLELPFVVSVYDLAGADFAQQMGAAAIKIASTNIVHAPLIEYVAVSGRPVILDTGKSTLAEVERAIQWALSAGCEQLSVQHSPVPPPAPIELQSLGTLTIYQQRFNIPVGLSDHHAGDEMLFAATALGARTLEKGVCPANTSDQDAFHALPIDRLQEVISKINNIHHALQHAERATDKPRPAARMGLVARRTIRTGESYSLENVTFAFPTIGIAVEDWHTVQGTRCLTDIQQGQPIYWENVEATAP